jgi:hypothetical protein
MGGGAAKTFFADMNEELMTENRVVREYEQFFKSNGYEQREIEIETDTAST